MSCVRIIARHPLPVLAALAVITMLSFVPILHLRVDNSIDNWLLENDPGIQAYDEFRREFQNDEYIVIGYRPPGGVLSDQGLELARRLTEELSQVDGVLDVDSIVTVEEIRASGDVLSVGNLVRSPLSDTERRRILSKLSHDRLYRGSLASSDGSAGAILVKVERVDTANISRRWKIIDDVRAVADAAPIPLFLTGGVMFDHALFHTMVQDQRLLIPLMMVIFVVVLAWLFRTTTGVVLPSLTVAVSIVWTFALIELTGFTLNVVAAILPVVLLAIGVADSVHLISEYQEQLAGKTCKRAALVQAVSTVLVPCLFTSVTTAMGFLGLLAIRVAPLREFGLFAAVGTMLAFVATFTMVPAALAVLPPPPPRRAASGTRRLSLVSVFAFVSTHRSWILAASAVFMVTGLAGLPGVRTSANWYRYLHRNNPVIQATDFVEDNIGGVYTIELLVRATEDGTESIKSLDAMREIQELERQLESDPFIERTLSPADFIATMNRTMHGDDPAFERLPESRNAIGQLLLMYEMDAPDGRLYDFVNFDFSRGRIMARSRMSEADVHHRFLDKARTLAKSFQHISAIPTGLMVLYNDVERHMLTGMITGFSVAFIAVSVMMVILLRTFRHGLLAMIPGALPVVFVVGMTGWLGVALGTMPAMMGNVALGIAVDNAIHMLTRYRRLRRSGMEPHGAIGQAAMVVGRPVLFTTTVLCLGFGVLGFSRLVPNQFFGILTAIVLFGSLVGALVTLPATILVVDEWSAARQATPVPPQTEVVETRGTAREPVEPPAADSAE